MLTDVLNHRGRNIRTVIRFLSRQSRALAGSIESDIETREARIKAVATTHSPVSEHLDTFARVQSMFALAAEAHSVEGLRVEVPGDDTGQGVPARSGPER